MGAKTVVWKTTFLGVFKINRAPLVTAVKSLEIRNVKRVCREVSQALAPGTRFFFFF